MVVKGANQYIHEQIYKQILKGTCMHVLSDVSNTMTVIVGRNREKQF